eukprot:9146593-Pyramimonas_sp.AAC.1
MRGGVGVGSQCAGGAGAAGGSCAARRVLRSVERSQGGRVQGVGGHQGPEPTELPLESSDG